MCKKQKVLPAELLPHLVKIASGEVGVAEGISTITITIMIIIIIVIITISTIGTYITITAGISNVDNVSNTFAEYLEVAFILGQEALEFGASRVARAEFHGDSADARLLEADVRNWPHRADVILWALARAAPWPEGRPVYVAEIGVNHGETSERLLNATPEIHWLGVDPYFRIDEVGTAEGGKEMLLARARLGPWLGRRASLLVTPSGDGAKFQATQPKLDLLIMYYYRPEHDI